MKNYSVFTIPDEYVNTKRYFRPVKLATLYGVDETFLNDLIDFVERNYNCRCVYREIMKDDNKLFVFCFKCKYGHNGDMSCSKKDNTKWKQSRGCYLGSQIKE